MRSKVRTAFSPERKPLDVNRALNTLRRVRNAANPFVKASEKRGERIQTEQRGTDISTGN